MNSIRSFIDAVEALRRDRRCALMPFLVAGDPDLQTTASTLLALQSAGADLIELGIPYSDPLADGPVIQAAASRALAAGTTPGRVLDQLAELRDRLITPVVLNGTGPTSSNARQPRSTYAPADGGRSSSAHTTDNSPGVRVTV